MRIGPWAIAILFIFSLASGIAEASPTTDPYLGIEEYTFKNGLKVVLAPSNEAKTLQIRVKVKVGDYSDGPGQAGIAHLLEHSLFTNAKTQEGMTYLETIKEKGGSANATTSVSLTQYFATVPPKLSAWIIELFGKMLIDRKFDPALLEQTKGPVALEIGQVSVMDYIEDLRAVVTHKLRIFPGFWQTEFDIYDPLASLPQARIDLSRITAGQLNEFYNRFYHPDNFVLYLSGNFKVTEVLPKIRKAFESTPFRAGDAWREPSAHPRWNPYIRSSSTFGTASIEVGTKVDFENVTQEISTRVYLKHLAHRLMKEIRNIKGDTYTVRASLYLRKAYGKAAIIFEAPTRSYAEYLKRVRSLIESEAREGKVSEEIFNEAKKLYLESYTLRDRDSSTLMRNAERWLDLRENYPVAKTTDYQAYENLNYADFKASLTLVFARDRVYEHLIQPPFLFRYEEVLLLIIGFGFWMFATRKAFVRKFKHDQVRWVRKLSYPPAYLVQLLALSLGSVIATLGAAALNQVWLSSGLMGFHFLISDYLYSFFDLGIVLFSCQWVMGFFARKMMVVEGQLWIKSISYSAKVISLQEIQMMEVMHTSTFLMMPSRLFKVLYRFEFYDPCFWRPGLYIELKNGRAHFVGVKNPEQAHAELSRMLREISTGEESASPVLKAA